MPHGHESAATEAAVSTELASTTSSHAERVANWDLPLTRNDRVDYWIDYLQGRRHQKMQLWLDNSGKYIPMIRERLRKQVKGAVHE